LLKCLGEDQARYVLARLHKGICGINIRAQCMAFKVLRVRHWKDAHDFSRRCQKCM